MREGEDPGYPLHPPPLPQKVDGGCPGGEKDENEVGRNVCGAD